MYWCHRSRDPMWLPIKMMPMNLYSMTSTPYYDLTILWLAWHTAYVRHPCAHYDKRLWMSTTAHWPMTQNRLWDHQRGDQCTCTAAPTAADLCDTLWFQRWSGEANCSLSVTISSEQEDFKPPYIVGSDTYVYVYHVPWPMKHATLYYIALSYWCYAYWSWPFPE